MKLGELIGAAVRDATLEALRWQNGLEPSYTRSIFTALARFGLREETFFDDIAPFLTEHSLELLRKNSKSVFYEPLVGAAAYAFAPRARSNSLRDFAGSAPAWKRSAMQAAVMAASLSATNTSLGRVSRATQRRGSHASRTCMRSLSGGPRSGAPNAWRRTRRFSPQACYSICCWAIRIIAAHPVRLMGWTLSRIGKLVAPESVLMDTAEAFALFRRPRLRLGRAASPLAVAALPAVARRARRMFLIYSLLALRDLLRHGWYVESAAAARRS